MIVLLPEFEIELKDNQMLNQTWGSELDARAPEL